MTERKHGTATLEETKKHVYKKKMPTKITLLQIHAEEVSDGGCLMRKRNNVDISFVCLYYRVHIRQALEPFIDHFTRTP